MFHVHVAIWPSRKMTLVGGFVHTFINMEILILSCALSLIGFHAVAVYFRPLVYA